MATDDYDSLRKHEEEISEESIEELKVATSVSSLSVDEDETDVADSFELPGADLSNEELLVRVTPEQEDEFTCTSCWLVRHRSQLVKKTKNSVICKECLY